MPKFQYRALDDSGQMRVGTIEAASRAAVLPELEKLAFFPVDVSFTAQHALADVKIITVSICL